MDSGRGASWPCRRWRPWKRSRATTARRDETLPPVKPIDKIIVAFAGPLFSFLLALTAALVVWGVGKPHDFVESTTVGYVMSDGPAAKAGVQIGDEILSINGQKVEGFMGTLDSVSELIMLSEGDAIELVVKRPGVTEPVALESRFKIPERAWFRRKGLRQIGIWVENKTIVGMVVENGPADRAGLEAGDENLRSTGRSSSPTTGPARSSRIRQQAP